MSFWKKMRHEEEPGGGAKGECADQPGPNRSTRKEEPGGDENEPHEMILETKPNVTNEENSTKEK